MWQRNPIEMDMMMAWDLLQEKGFTGKPKILFHHTSNQVKQKMNLLYLMYTDCHVWRKQSSA